MSSASATRFDHLDRHVAYGVGPTRQSNLRQVIYIAQVSSLVIRECIEVLDSRHDLYAAQPACALADTSRLDPCADSGASMKQRLPRPDIDFDSMCLINNS